MRSVYGLPHYNAFRILEATLNLREIRIYSGTVYNEGETLAAQRNGESSAEEKIVRLEKETAAIFQKIQNGGAACPAKGGRGGSD